MNGDRCFLLVVAINGPPSDPKSLGGEQHVDIESHGIRGGPAHLSRLSPQLRRKAKGIVGKWHIPVRGGVHEGVKAGDSNSLVSPQKFAFDLVIDDGRNHNAGTREKTVFEPVRYCDDFLAALRLRYQAERSGIEEKNVAHG
jgi:hypothetical protein